MATSYKLQQLASQSTGLTDYKTLYSTGASTTAVISTITITNTSATQQQYRVAIMGSEGTPATQNFLVYNDSLAGNDTVALTLGVTLDNTKYIRVSASSSDVAFNAFVSEIS